MREQYGFSPESTYLIQTFEAYRDQTGDGTLAGFVRHVRETLGKDVHAYMTDADLDQLCVLTSTSADECEQILMETAWP